MHSARKKIFDTYRLWTGPTYSPVLYKFILLLYYFNCYDIIAYNPFDKLMGIIITSSHVNKVKQTVVE